VRLVYDTAGEADAQGAGKPGILFSGLSEHRENGVVSGVVSTSILLVIGDDEERLHLRRALSGEGWRVIPAGTGAQARQMAARRLLTPNLLKMFLVWVRKVLSDTISCWAISGPLNSLRSSLSTSSSRSLKGSIMSDF